MRYTILLIAFCGCNSTGIESGWVHVSETVNATYESPTSDVPAFDIQADPVSVGEDWKAAESHCTALCASCALPSENEWVAVIHKVKPEIVMPIASEWFRDAPSAWVQLAMPIFVYDAPAAGSDFGFRCVRH
jgi:hypothetical protein